MVENRLWRLWNLVTYSVRCLYLMAGNGRLKLELLSSLSGRHPYAPLRRLYQRHPNELWGVVKLLVARLRATDATLADSVFLDVTGRTAKRLLELAGDKDEFTLPITQEELAGIVGASRERVNKAISAFVRLNWITLTDRRYTITNREQLTIRAR